MEPHRYLQSTTNSTSGGKLLIASIAVLDRPVVVAYLLTTVTMFIVINLVVDLLYSALDPRIRLEDIKS